MHNQVGVQFPGDTTWMEAKAINISYGGIGLYLSKRLLVGQEVLIRIAFLSANDVVEFETVAGTVRWCRAQGFGFATRIKFQDLDPDEHSKLVAFLEEAESFKDAIYNPSTSNLEESHGR